MKISVVIPAYNESENLYQLLEKLYNVLENLKYSFEIIVVDDGSTDKTKIILAEEIKKRKGLRAVIFRRNFGQTAAISAGIANSTGDVIIPMDADLQNDPEDVPRLLKEIENGNDVVSGWRRKRRDPLFSRTMPSKIANILISWISKVHLHDYGCTLKAYRKEIIHDVQLFGEMHRFIPIYASWLGAKVCEIEVAHHPRTSGKSNYGLSRTLKVVLDLLTIKFLGSFITRPIHIFGGMGLLCFLSSIILILLTLYEKIRLGVWVHQNPLLLIGIFFSLVGVLLIMMGLLGELLTRIYFSIGKQPPYTIKEIITSCAE